MNGPDNANHELIFYYIDHGRNRDEALKVAEMEMNRRQDVFYIGCLRLGVACEQAICRGSNSAKEPLRRVSKILKILEHASAILPAR